MSQDFRIKFPQMTRGLYRQQDGHKTLFNEENSI